MFSRWVSLFAAVVLVVTPTVRAICDVSCVTLPEAPHQAAPRPSEAAGHCAAQPGGSSSTPAPADDCGHDHAAWDSILVPASKADMHPKAVAVVFAAVRGLPSTCSGLPILTRIPPDPPFSSRPRPLRI